MSLGGSQKCATCNKSVYPMERLVVDGVVFHKGKCFVCEECGNCLRPGNYASLAGKYYCKPHFKKLFQVKGNYSEGFGEEDPKKRWAPTGIAAPPKDMKSAAAAGSKSDSKPEVVKSTPADSKPEIVKSTPASEPARNLYISGDQPASQTNAEVKKEEPVAVAPAKKEEPKAAEPAPSKPEVVKSTPASQPARDLYISGDQPASQTNSEIKKEEPKQEAAPVKKEEPKAVAPAPVAAAPAPVAAAPAPVKKEEPKAVAPSAVAAAAAAPAKSSSGGGLGGSQKCATCAKSVYPMERLVVDGIVFHKGKCFVCAECGNCLRPGNYASLGGKYYCKPHFKKLFQVKGNYSEGFGEEDPKKRWAPSGIAAPPKDMKSAAAAGKN